jgi:PIN domain nuclease of toxin-antitoxin system
VARYLLDTQILLWALTDDPRLSGEHKRIYLDRKSELFLSVASIWEIIIKVGIGKLQMPTPAVAYLRKQLELNGIMTLPIRLRHLAELETLPPVHRDPFDRMLLAQSAAEDMPLVTADEQIHKYVQESAKPRWELK